MARILILIGAHLCTAPRPQKEADLLAKAGHDITVCGVWFDEELVERDRQIIANKAWLFQPVLDFRSSRDNRWQHLMVRLQARIVRTLFRRFGWFSPSLLGYGVRKLLKEARTRKADLTIVHSESGLWVGRSLLSQGLQVGVDFEDWFSRDLLPGAIRPVRQLEQLERFLAQHCIYCLTTSQALSESIASTYNVPRPTVIYNAFSQSNIAENDTADKLYQQSTIKLHWFSQKIGPGRGLELLFQALHQLDLNSDYSIEIYLRGQHSEETRYWVNSQVPNAWRSHIFLESTVSNEKLLACTAQYDIGLALEQSTPPSRNLTITNKLFQYLQAGLAVIATPTAGQREILTQNPQVGALMLDFTPEAFVAVLEPLVRSPQRLIQAKRAARQKFEKHYAWEHQQHKLLTAVDRALGISCTNAINYTYE